MIVYIESNFVIEHSRRQAQYPGCEGILSLAENREIKLILPFFSIEGFFVFIQSLQHNQSK